MAWRDSRRNRGRLLLFISSIVLGIAALVAINSFSANLKGDIDREARSLLGADLQLELTSLPTDSVAQMMDQLGGERAATTNFASMAYFPHLDETRLVYVRALEGRYPLYGKMAVSPANAYDELQAGRGVLADKTLMLQFGLQPGDSIRLGALGFVIAGQLDSAPGRAGVAASIAPTVFIPAAALEATNLVQKGSRVEYQYYYKLPADVVVDSLLSPYRTALQAANVRVETVRDRKESLGRAFGGLNTFLNLVGFIALLLGCIGVASAVNIYLREKLATVAVLRCLGASGQQAFAIYLIQIVAIGLGGALLGALLGSLLQWLLPVVLADFLPIQDVSRDLSWPAVLTGVLTGLVISVLFALLPLLGIRRVAPLRTLRVSDEADGGTSWRDPWYWVVVVLIFGWVTGFAYVQTGTLAEAIAFPVALAAAFLLLAAVSQLIIWVVKRFFPHSWGFVARQGLANLFRPNNQTLILMVAIGLGTALLSTLFITQDLLLSQLRLSGSGERPNMILFDIQTPQRQGVAQLAIDQGLPVIQDVPLVTMRITDINGVSREQRLRDSTSDVAAWVYNREYRATYRDSLIDSETLVEGAWTGKMPASGLVPVSLAENMMDGMKAGIGSRITFDVQGTLIDAEVTSIRKVDFNRVQTNFMVVFPTGVLEQAPQFHVLVTRTASEAQSAGFQQALVRQFPNVSVVDLTQILRTVDDVLGKVSFVIRFMALFSIFTGLLVLVSSIMLSKYQRVKESVLLRTLGASRQQILRINAVEYALLGSLAALTGLLIAFVSSALLAVYQLDIPFTPRWWPALAIFGFIVALTVALGLLNSRSVLRESPLEVLRREV